MQSLSKKDITKIVGAAALIVIALFTMYHLYAESQPHVVQQINLPVGSSENGQAMKNGQGDQATKPQEGESASDNIDPSKFKH
ncbi:MAG: hypothetical protein JWL77_3302 [Chthonomonadaceae bacterium]|nr:hypothetical protein [Chthonomonadaceae bacterium]